MWWNRSGAGGPRAPPTPRCARGGRDGGRPPRGAGRCVVWRGVGASRRPPPLPTDATPRPTPRVGRLSSLDPPARARSNDRRRADPSQPRRARARWGWSGAARAGVAGGRATWLILPVVICLSQRLSHACVSMN
ncbi:unnamed protein product [Spirodela intermedia]|uniref:Uncharacterized protein n=1 Tax=Spirodela intermedia TaxID=51605 RepID=A0A811G6Q5_SPIIN|nr:unnamed protein product [Spirodela intermedia]